MRRTLLWGSTNPWLAHRLPRYRFVRRAVRRFMPGETLEEALAESAALGERGIPTILTLLGENVATPEEAGAVVDAYVEILAEAAGRGLDAQISVKPSQLGMDLDAGRVRDAVARLAREADGKGTVWIDMEGSAYTDATLELFRDLRSELDNVGVCLQAYLRRTADDLEGLLPLDPAIRLVKGAYAEPPAIAFPKKSDVDANFLRLAGRLLDHLDGAGHGFVAFGTHDPKLHARIAAVLAARGTPAGSYEFEMLYGIGVRDQESLSRGGQPLRVLISYGSAWFPWYMRRLAERPANVWFVLRSLFR